MHSFTLVLFAALVAVAYAGGQFYVPRSYYIIDAEGHESAPVPLRRLRRSVMPYPYNAEANANANANANARGGGNARANANANARADARGAGSYDIPSGGFGSSNPNLLSAGMTSRQAGPVVGRSVSASTSVDLDSSGYGTYEQSATVY